MPNNYLQHRIGIASIAPICSNRKKHTYFHKNKSKSNSFKLHNFFAIIFLIIFAGATATPPSIDINIRNDINKSTIFNCHDSHNLYIKNNGNFLTKMRNGNIEKYKNLKIMQYNKGN